MNRTERAALAEQTLAICQVGSYQTPNGTHHDLRAAIAASCAETRLYEPDSLPMLLAQTATVAMRGPSTIEVTNQTTLAAAAPLALAGARVACLNFASAKNPGGGFLGGSQAQEESLARASALYPSLQTQPAFYAFHRVQGSAFYSDRIILSPRVLVFRDDEGHLLDQPWQCDILTAAAVNAGAVLANEPQRRDEIVPTMRRRTRMLLALAALQSYDLLVLGAWGCGVFRNDPATIATIFAEILSEAPLAGRMPPILFAVYDRSPDQATIAPFRRLAGRTIG